MVDDISPGQHGSEAIALRDLFYELEATDSWKLHADYRARRLVATPYDGSYGFAGVVVVLEGSPPRGMFIVPQESLVNPMVAITYVAPHKSRHYKGHVFRKIHKTVTAYVRSLGYTGDRKPTPPASYYVSPHPVTPII